MEVDYMVIGAGVTGLSFVDELLYSTTDLTFIIIDKYSQPGGHWNNSYDFVTLHQPAHFFGVKSLPLSSGTNDLSSHNELRVYFEHVMKNFLSTGRVKYFPQCEYKGGSSFQSLLEPDQLHEVKVNKKIVNAAYIGPYNNIPATRTPTFHVGPDVHMVPVNGLSHTKAAWERYVIIGGGKTGIDAVLFLLDRSVKADRITWIIPNDSWLVNRKFVFVDRLSESIFHDTSPILKSETFDQLLKTWEESNKIIRLDPTVTPKAFKAATVSEDEVNKLRLVKNILRQGRVDRLERGSIIFINGEQVETDTNTLFVDCTANGAPPIPATPIFDGSRITLQTTRVFQPAYSASVIAAFEARFPDDEEKKNRLLAPIETPQSLESFMYVCKQYLMNENNVAQTLGFRWLRSNHLDWN